MAVCLLADAAWLVDSTPVEQHPGWQLVESARLLRNCCAAVSMSSCLGADRFPSPCNAAAVSGTESLASDRAAANRAAYPTHQEEP